MSNMLSNSRPGHKTPSPQSIEQELGGPLGFLDLEPSTITSLDVGFNQGDIFKKKSRMTGHSHFSKNQSYKNNKKETQRNHRETVSMHAYMHTHTCKHPGGQTQMSTCTHTENTHSSVHLITEK